MSAVLGVALGATAALAQNNTYPWPQSGNIGIRTSSPTYYGALDVNTSDHKAIRLMDTTYGGMMLGYDGSTIQARTTGESNAQDLLLQPYGGNVGIGATPGHKLTVNGHVNLMVHDILGVTGISSNNGYDLWLKYGSTGGAVKTGAQIQAPSLRLGGNGDGTAWTAGITGPVIQRAGNVALAVDSGYVGIGTAAPAARLDVAGMTRTMCLQITGGCDLAEPFVVRGGQPSAGGDRRSAGLGPSSASPAGPAGGPIGEPRPGPGLVVVIDPDRAGQLKLCAEAYDRKVAGVISGANGLAPGMVLTAAGNPATRPALGMENSESKTENGEVMGDQGGSPNTENSSHPVALTGRVWCWCDAGYGAITPGDRLTTSATPGHAMKAADPDRAGGAVIGKAMSRLEQGKGLVLVLVQPQ